MYILSYKFSTSCLIFSIKVYASKTDKLSTSTFLIESNIFSIFWLEEYSVGLYKIFFSKTLTSKFSFLNLAKYFSELALGKPHLTVVEFKFVNLKPNFSDKI